LSDTNLIVWYGQNFASKYTQPNELLQIAANIVDYIRPGGPALQIPTDSSPLFPAAYKDTTPPIYLGLRQTPYINELVVSNSFEVITNGVSPLPSIYLSITTAVNVELWNMYPNQWLTSAYTPDVLVSNLPSILVPGFGNVSLASPDITSFPPSMNPMPGSTYGFVSANLTTN